MQIVQKALCNPKGLQQSKHYQIAWHIAGGLRERAMNGLTTTILKVKSHSGIKGNDMADEIAKDACFRGEHMPYTHALHIGNQPYHDKYWVARVPTPDRPDLYFLTDIGKETMQIALSTKCCLGGSATSTYATLMENAMVHACTPTSNAFWSLYQNKSISYKHVVNCLRIRSGTLWTAKFAALTALPW
jgi:hypothetical protein